VYYYCAAAVVAAATTTARQQTQQEYYLQNCKNAKLNISLLLEFFKCFHKRMNIESRNLLLE